MVANASREVLFVLKPIPSEDAAAQFGRMVTMAEAANQKILQATEKASDEWAKAWAAATERTVGGRIDAEQRALQKQVSSQEKAMERQQREQEKAARAQEKAIERQAKEEERARRQAEKEEEKRFKAQVAMLEAAAKAEKKRWEDEKKAREDAEETARRTQEKALKDQERAQRQAESAVERQRSAAMAAKMSIAELGEGVTRAGRGLAALGIVGEESTEKLVRAFIKVQAAFDLVAGGLKVYKSLVVAVDAYTKSVEAAAVAERALAVARGQSAVAGGASAAGGVAGRFLPTIGGGPMVAAGAILAGAAVAGGRGLYEASNPQAGGENSWFRPGSMGGWAAKSNIMELWGQEGTGTLQRRAMEAEERTKRLEAERKRIGEQSELARAAEQERQADLAALADAQRQRQMLSTATRPEFGGLMAAGNERRSALEATRPDLYDTDEAKGTYVLAQAQLQRELALQQQQAAAQAGLDTARGQYGVESQSFTAAQEEARRAREQLAELQAGKGVTGQSAADRARLEETVAATAKAEEEAMSRLTAANDQRIRQEEQIAGIRQAAAENAIQKTQEEIALRDTLIEKDRQRLMTAAERIASMTKAEQEQYGQLIQKARRGGELSAEEFRRLGTVSTEETERLRRDYAERMSAGFFQQFGVGDIERQRMERMRKERNELEVRLKDERKISVDVQIDSERIVNEAYDAIKTIMDERLGEIETRLNERLGRENTAGQRRAAEAAQARGAVIR